MVEGAAQRRWNRPRTSADLDDPAVGIVLHHHTARVARQPPGRFRGNVRARLFEDRLARLVRVRERRRIDVDDHLVSLARGAGIELVVQRRLGQQRERVGSLLGRHRRFRRAVARLLGRLRGVRPPIQRFAGGVERATEQRTDLGLEPSADDHHALPVLVDLKRSAGMLRRGVASLGLTVDTAPSAHDPLHVDGRSRSTNREWSLLRLRRGNSRKARTLVYESSPRSSAWARSGNAASARATRTFSRAAPRSRPTRQLSQWAHERKPVFQP